MAKPQYLYIDIETRSSVDLISYGVYAYTESPDFEILMAAWAVDNGPVQVAIGQAAAYNIPYLWDDDVAKVAHNAQFERVCLSRLAGLPCGTYLPPNFWIDTAAIAGEHGYPQSLEDLSRWLGGEQKDTAGKRLINLFCKPKSKGGWTQPQDKPDDWLDFIEYCRQDVVTLRDVHKSMDGFPTDEEWRVYLADQAINDRGMPIDVEMAKAAVVAAEENRIDQTEEVKDITGIENPASVQQLLVWLDLAGYPLPDLQKATVDRALADQSAPNDVHMVLRLRQELALVAHKKYATALGSVSSDCRLRGGFRFFGAHTGRWAGRGVQLHNLPRHQLADEATTDAAILDLKSGWGATSDTLKALVRSLFVGPFTVADYSSIEARVIAWLAGEQWALDAFYADREIYVETAERMSTPTRKLTRSQGKVAVLALGYNGGINSLRAMGADGSDADLQVLVNQWRAANPAIVEFWRAMGAAFIRGGEVSDLVHVTADGSDRYVWLPSGRAITYHQVKAQWEETTYGPRPSLSFADPKKPGARVRTYGGRLTENAVQAVARDVLAGALVRLEAAGYRVVGHVHDEIIVEGAPPLDEVVRLMTATPAWGVGLPLDAKGEIVRRYRKL